MSPSQEITEVQTMDWREWLLIRCPEYLMKTSAVFTYGRNNKNIENCEPESPQEILLPAIQSEQQSIEAIKQTIQGIQQSFIDPSRKRSRSPAESSQESSSRKSSIFSPRSDVLSSQESSSRKSSIFSPRSDVLSSEESYELPSKKPAPSARSPSQTIAWSIQQPSESPKFPAQEKCSTQEKVSNLFVSPTQESIEKSESQEEMTASAESLEITSPSKKSSYSTSAPQRVFKSFSLSEADMKFPSSLEDIIPTFKNTSSNPKSPVKSSYNVEINVYNNNNNIYDKFPIKLEDIIPGFRREIIPISPWRSPDNEITDTQEEFVIAF